MNFKGIRKYIIAHLGEMLDERYSYHSIKHTLQVEKAVVYFSEMEGIPEKEIILLRTAALFHDSGYINKYRNNESFSVSTFKKVASEFDYTEDNISNVKRIIMATKRGEEPKDILEKLICDADHDYIGTANYHNIAQQLRDELALFGELLSDKEWIMKQIHYLEEEHQYYTESAISKRQAGKEARLKELKLDLLNFKE